jgi:hypothetical protein
MPLSPAAQKSLAKWREMVAKRDLSALETIVAPDAVFRSPVAYPPYPGREATCLVLRTADSVFEDFVYHREFVAGADSVALEFSARIGDKKLNAMDIIRYNEAGLIQEFEVMVRPATGLMALGAAMQAKLGSAAAKLKGG